MTETTDRAALIAEALKVSERHYDFCTPGCPRGDHDHRPSLTARLVSALADAEREIAERAAKIERIESAYARVNRAQLRTLELDREFLQQVADSYGIRTDEVTEAFLARAAGEIRTAAFLEAAVIADNMDDDATYPGEIAAAIRAASLSN